MNMQPKGAEKNITYECQIIKYYSRLKKKTAWDIFIFARLYFINSSYPQQTSSFKIRCVNLCHDEWFLFPSIWPAFSEGK